MLNDLIEDHPKTVALSLFVVLIAWGVASGLWIHRLNATIQSKEDALTERSAQAEELRTSLEQRHEDEVALLKQENAYLTEQVRILRRAANNLSIALAKVTTVLNEASANPSANHDSYKAELAGAVGELERQSDEMSRSIERIDAGASRREGHEAAAPPAASRPDADRRASHQALAWLIASLATLALLLFSAYLYRKHQELEKREIRLRQERERLMKMSRSRDLPSLPSTPPTPRS